MHGDFFFLCTEIKKSIFTIVNFGNNLSMMAEQKHIDLEIAKKYLYTVLVS